MGLEAPNHHSLTPADKLLPVPMGKNEIAEDSSAQKKAFQRASYQAQVDAFEQTPFYNRTPQDRVAFLQKRQARGETLTAAVVDSFYADDPNDARNWEELPPQELNRMVKRQKVQSDINNDGYRDQVMHGDMVSPYYKHDGVQVIPIDISGVRAEQHGKSDIKLINEGLSKIERGDIKTDIVHLSLSLALVRTGTDGQDFPNPKITFKDLEHLSGVKDITRENFAEKREQIVTSFEKQHHDKNLATFDKEAFYNRIEGRTNQNNDMRLIRQKLHERDFIKTIVEMVQRVERLNRMGIVTVISAGNRGKDAINVYSLARNAVVVGALNENGNKANFSSENSLVTHWRQGVYPVKRTKDGIDITGDGKADFSSDVLNPDAPQPPFEGKKLSEVKGEITPEFKEKAKVLRKLHGGQFIPLKEWNKLIYELNPNQLYRQTELSALRGLITKALALEFRDNRRYVTPDRSVVMIKNEKGFLENVFKKPMPNIVGTSSAAPSILRKDSSAEEGSR